MSPPRLFGTDGIRGAFGTYPLDESTVRRLGRVLGRRLRRRHPAPRLVLGGDTRDSTPVLAGWLRDGLGAECHVTFLGTVPTPAVARATRALGAACGVAISASHNPHPDNGLKLIDEAGFKWTPAAEAELEAELDTQDGAVTAAATPDLARDTGTVRDYLAALAAALPDGDGPPLGGLAVALDAGNGAASPYAEELFASLGAQVTLVHAAPDGTNINAGCGSTHPEVIAEVTCSSDSAVGFSFDGDADRVILADENGDVHDGDAILYLWARDLAVRDALPGRRVVATSMSNLGLEVALGRLDVELVRCDVGDRVVVNTMRRAGVVLGGEQSGHIVNLDLGTTGDGLLTALMMAYLRARDAQPLSQMIRGFERFPQLIRNVRVREKVPFERLPEVAETSRRVHRELGTDGRLVLRYSGTEPLARIMIEGRLQSQIDALAEELAATITLAVGE